MKAIFYDVNNKLSFGRIMGFISIICGVALFIISISFNWHNVKVQSELFDLVKWMFGQGAGLYGVSKLLEKPKGE